MTLLWETAGLLALVLLIAGLGLGTMSAVIKASIKESAISTTPVHEQPSHELEERMSALERNMIGVLEHLSGTCRCRA